jgi:hypothetical protein
LIWREAFLLIRDHGGIQTMSLRKI